MLNILIVEDEPGWQAVYTDLLAEAGYLCHLAASYGEARGLLQRHPFALAIVDLHLASAAARSDNQDGLWLLKAAQQRNIPAIVVSALGEPTDIDRVYDEFGVFAFVEKEIFVPRTFPSLVAEAIASAAVSEATEAETLLGELTDRERDVLDLLVQGRTNRQIAETLHITPNTVKKHVDHIFQKLGVDNRAAAVAAALRR